MMGRRVLGRLAAGVVLALAFPAVHAAAQAGPALPFATIARGLTSGIRVPAHHVVRDRETWQALWRDHAGPAAGQAPAVDFAREMVIAVFAGELTAPAQTAITRITREADHLAVWYTVTELRPFPLDPSVPTQRAPFHIVQTPRSPLPVRFVRLRTPPIVRPGP